MSYYIDWCADNPIQGSNTWEEASRALVGNVFDTVEEATAFYTCGLQFVAKTAAQLEYAKATGTGYAVGDVSVYPVAADFTYFHERLVKRGLLFVSRAEAINMNALLSQYMKKRAI